MSENTIVQGNDVILKYTVTDQDGAPVNLTLSTIKWAIKKTAEDNPALSKQTGSGISITNATGGIFQVTLNATEQAELLGKYIMEAMITDINGKIYTITNDLIEPDYINYRLKYTE